MLLPLLMPAILASMLIVFALSIDDFVVTQYMSVERGDDDDPDVPLLERPRRHEHAGAERAGDDPRRRRRCSGSTLAYLALHDARRAASRRASGQFGAARAVGGSTSA